MTCDMETWLGAYVLDALEPDEAAAVQAHLAGCSACQDEVIGLAWIPELLASANIAEIESVDDERGQRQPPSLLLERLLASAAAERRTRKHRRGAISIACAAIVTAGAATTALANGSPPHATVVHAVDPSTHVDAAVTVSARSWGSALELQLSGAYPGGRCSLIARAEDGRTDVAASWVASKAGTASVPGATAIPVDQLAELDVVTSNGSQLVRIAIPDLGR
jgi:hypothetical protein